MCAEQMIDFNILTPTPTPTRTLTLTLTLTPTPTSNPLLYPVTMQSWLTQYPITRPEVNVKENVKRPKVPPVWSCGQLNLKYSIYD